MDKKEFVTSKGKGCLLTVDVIPGARKSEIVGANKWRAALVIRLAARPEQGAANSELVRFLADLLAVRKDQIRIAIGGKSRHKVLHLDLPSEKVLNLLGDD